MIPEYHKISIGILTQAVIVVITRHTFHSHQTIEFVPELVLIYMGKGVDFFPFNGRRIASNTKDFILFFVNIEKILLFRRYILLSKISKTSAAP